jgi:hypothetical protein
MLLRSSAMVVGMPVWTCPEDMLRRVALVRRGRESSCVVRFALKIARKVCLSLQMRVNCCGVCKSEALSWPVYSVRQQCSLMVHRDVTPVQVVHLSYTDCEKRPWSSALMCQI